QESSGELVALRKSGFPFVVVDPRIPLDEGLTAVAAARGAGALAATEHLLSLGHRRIGHISGPGGWAATTERIEGYHSALAVAVVLLMSELIVEGTFEAQTGVAAANVLLDLPDRPTAIFAANDNMAAGVLQVAHERGLTVPGDLSVVGFDDADLATILSPALTTVRQPLHERRRTGLHRW